MGRVFVSHAKEDSAVAERISGFLESRGVSCWIAPRDVPGGMEYGAAILQGIEESSVLLLVLSEQSNESQFVHREVERAVSKAKPVLPIRIREIAPSGALEFFLSQAQWVDAWQPPIERHLDNLLRAIQVLAGNAPTTAGTAHPTAAATLSARGRRRRGVLPAVLGLVALAVLAAVLFWAPWQGAERKGAADFLAGTWCQPMSGDASATWRFTALGQDRVNGEITYTHSTERHRFDATATWTDKGLTLVFTAPPELVGGEPIVFTQDGENRLSQVVTETEGVIPPEPMTRCPG
ncbi:MAG TPA: toll/interleukin-1 receptor domain-containing protein [Kiloniellales bacterium]|nr:toll/interleukin-1 receptor domain-containing protein [Kiloniellales bacterium]